MRSSVSFIAVISAALLASAPLSAHVTLEAREAPADSYFKAVFSVPHGCEGSPTTRIRVRIPDGVTGVKPQPKTGWELATVKTKLATPAKGSHGEAVGETITEVSWSGGKLLDEHFDQFTMQVRLPNAVSGTMLYFPIVQECEKGITRWIEIPQPGAKPGGLREPAPALRLIAKP
ncbi:MAG: hypothetical protein K0Q70_1915 [Rhodospirillales bacterium]|nr:hypothetical protein [Rhodospirillales bacterium]